MKETIGFIGFGLMGKPMANQILAAGYPLWVYNRTAAKTADIQAAGAHVARSASELADHAAVVITMLTDGQAVEAVLFGPHGAAESVNKPTVIDMSTIGKQKAVSIAERLRQNGMAFLDAPVTGSTSKATTGELTIFVGGQQDILETCRPILSAMGTNIVYMGPAGSGQAMKLINNFLTATFNEAMMEAMLLADGMALPRQKVADGLVNTPNIPDGIKKNLPEYITESFPLTFSLSNLRKDLGLALDEMNAAHERLPTLERIEALYGEANADPELSAGSYRNAMTYLKRIYKASQ